MTAYLPYGAERGDTTDDLAIDRGWLGQYEDSGTGLTYLHARYYDPALGRFLSPDPLMDPSDPRTLDPYRYADNNPIVFTDPTGLCSTCHWSELDEIYGGGPSVYGPPKGQSPSATNPSSGGGGKGSSGVSGKIDVDKLLDTIAGERWFAPPPVNGVPQLDFKTKCLNYQFCTLPRDTYNYNLLVYGPLNYYDFYADGTPYNGRNGGEVKVVVEGPFGKETVYGFYYFLPMEQDLFSGVATSPSDPGSAPSINLEMNQDSDGNWRLTLPKVSSGGGRPGISPPANIGEELLSYAGSGTHTSPGWFQYNDGWSQVGGQVHQCWSSFSISSHDSEGLSGAQVRVVQSYNRCS
jgi:RHS repeat-associated protein